MNKQVKRLPINNEIRARKVFVVKDKDNLGEFSLNEALNMAEEEGVDLVQMSPGDIPTCRLMSYGDFIYHKNKQKAANKKSVVSLKEIQIRPKIAQHDLETKLRHALKFISKKHKVKVVLRLRGREIAHTELHIQNTLKAFVDKLSEVAQIEKPPKSESKNRVSMIIAPVSQA